MINKQIIKFGRYPQKNQENDQKQDIEWLVLDKKDGKALLLSQYALDVMPYNDKYERVTWETCTLRKWLNHNFLNVAFTEAERMKISGDVQLLSVKEANRYFESDSDRVCFPTIYAFAKNSNIVNTGGMCCWWWLRSPGSNCNRAADVNPSGSLDCDGLNVDFSSVAVRPAIWVELDVVDESAETSRDFDSISCPRHYADGNIECIDAMEDVFGVEAVKHFCLCNAFKYHWRHSLKGGEEDIKKAAWYMDKYKELVNR